MNLKDIYYVVFAIYVNWNFAVAEENKLKSTIAPQQKWNMTGMDYIKMFAKDQVKYIPKNVTFYDDDNDDETTLTTEEQSELQTLTEIYTTDQTEDTTLLHNNSTTSSLLGNSIIPGKTTESIALTVTTIPLKLLLNSTTDNDTLLPSTKSKYTTEVDDSSISDKVISVTSETPVAKISIKQLKVGLTTLKPDVRFLNAKKVTSIHTNEKPTSTLSALAEIHTKSYDDTVVLNSTTYLLATFDPTTRRMDDAGDSATTFTLPPNSTYSPAQVPNSTARVPNSTARVPNSTTHVPNSTTHVPSSTFTISTVTKESLWPSGAVTILIDKMKNISGNKASVDYGKFNTKPGTVISSTKLPSTESPSDHENWKKKEERMPTPLVIGLVLLVTLTVTCVISGIIGVQWYRHRKSLEDSISLMTDRHGQRRPFYYYDSTM